MAETATMVPAVAIPEVKEVEDVEMDQAVEESRETMGVDEEVQGGVTTGEPLLEPDMADIEREPRTPETEIVESAVSTDETDIKDVPKEEIAESVSNKGEISDTTNVIKADTKNEDVEDDIIVLDDEEEESGQSGASSSKRPRKEVTDVMEVDEEGLEAKRESIGKVIRKMSRADLEDLVLAKIVEAIVAHTDVGNLRAKVLELTMQKDKMAGKMAVMMKQVAELSSAVNVIMENEARDPKNRIGKPHVIRFNRSVGLQTTIEPGVRSAPPRIIRVPDASQNGLKQYGASVGKHTGYTGANGTFNPPQGQGVKRVYQGSKPGDNKGGQTAAIQPSPRKTYSPAMPNQPRIHPIIAPKPSTTQTVTVSSVPSQNVQPGIVDLTDDDPPSGAGSQPSTSTGNTTIINGVQYQIVSNRGTTNPGNVQIMSPGSQSQQKFIVTPATQQRPVLLQQVVGGPGTANQSFMLRGVNNVAPVTLVPRPVAPRPVGNNGGMPRVAATIPVRPPTGVVLGMSSNTPRRFVLPPLPATPIAKVKNDMFKAPPKPELTLNEQADGIVLSWNLPTVNNMAEVTTYQIFACQESLTNSPNRPSQWKRVGDVKALPLPMACTLSQFTEENRYYFIVRGIDVYGRVGPFCDPQKSKLTTKEDT